MKKKSNSNKSTTSSVNSMNRFPLFAVVAERAALRSGFSSKESKMLGLSVATLFAIFKNGRGGGNLKKGNGKSKGGIPVSQFNVPVQKQSSVTFCGMHFNCFRNSTGEVEKVFVGEEKKSSQTVPHYYCAVEQKLGRYYSGFCNRLDRIFRNMSPQEFINSDSPYEFYKSFRDDPKVKYGFNRINLDELVKWLSRREKQ